MLGRLVVPGDVPGPALLEQRVEVGPNVRAAHAGHYAFGSLDFSLLEREAAARSRLGLGRGSGIGLGEVARVRFRFLFRVRVASQRYPTRMKRPSCRAMAKSFSSRRARCFSTMTRSW